MYITSLLSAPWLALLLHYIFRQNCYSPPWVWNALSASRKWPSRSWTEGPWPFNLPKHSGWKCTLHNTEHDKVAMCKLAWRNCKKQLKKFSFHSWGCLFRLWYVSYILLLTSKFKYVRKENLSTAVKTSCVLRYWGLKNFSLAR